MKIKDILGVNPLNKKHRSTRQKPRHRGRDLVGESGSAPGVGPIHIDEIKPTLDPLSKALGVDLYKQALGSVGKKQFSGDIDVAINIPPEKLEEFGEKLKNHPLISYYSKTSVFITKIKIQNYDPKREMIDPRTGKSRGIPEGRTGFVQVDFMPGDPGWMKTYYHSPHEKDSKYKGVYRNIMIASIAGRLNVVASDEKTEDGRPLKMERWMWSPTDGLIRVVRTPEPNKKGDGYTKKNNNQIIDGPYKDPNQIAKKLGLNSADDLYSFETLWSAINKNYDKAAVKAIADDFANNGVVKDIGVPDEIS